MGKAFQPPRPARPAPPRRAHHDRPPGPLGQLAVAGSPRGWASLGLLEAFGLPGPMPHKPPCPQSQGRSPGGPGRPAFEAPQGANRLAGQGVRPRPQAAALAGKHGGLFIPVPFILVHGCVQARRILGPPALPAATAGLLARLPPESAACPARRRAAQAQRPTGKGGCNVTARRHNPPRRAACTGLAPFAHPASRPQGLALAARAKAPALTARAPHAGQSIQKR